MVRRVLSTRRHKAGVAPGTPIHIGERGDDGVRISVFEYDADTCVERELKSTDQCATLPLQSAVTWIDVSGVHNVVAVTQICRTFGIHPLVQEDIVNTDQRPKAEEYDGYLFAVVKMLSQPERNGQIEVEQVSVVVRDRLVISFQERSGDVFEALRARLCSAKGSVRRRGPDYLAYCLLDAIVDQYYLLLEQIEARIEPLEEAAIADPQPNVARAIQALKRDLLHLRRSLWPMREMIYRLSCEGAAVIEDDTRLSA